MNVFATKRHGKTLRSVGDRSNPCVFEFQEGLTVVVYMYEGKTLELVAFGSQDTTNGWWKNGIYVDKEAQITALLQTLQKALNDEARGLKQSVCELDLHTECLLVRYASEECKKKEQEITLPPVGPDVDGCDVKDYQRITACVLAIERMKSEEERYARMEEEELDDTETS